MAGLRSRSTRLATLLLLVHGAGAGQGEAATAGARPGVQPVTIAAPQAKLAELGSGEALDLGRYDCESRAPRSRCETIFDYSRLTFDHRGHRMLAFGGGHAATGRTDVDVFDLKTLSWRSLYPSMPCEAVALGDIDPRGFHRATGHPVARHTYDQNVVAEVNGQGWLLMFSSEGFSGTCHSYKATIQSVAALRLGAEGATWSYSAVAPLPWGYSGVAEFDPVSGMVVLFGGKSSGMWVYDPGKQRVVAFVRRFARPKNSSNLIYDPRGDRMLLFDSETMLVRAFTLDRHNWQATTETLIETSGERPPAFRNLAYDTRNHVIGGIRDGVFHAYDPATNHWQSHPVIARSTQAARIGTVRHHAIDYDPVNNVFILVAGRPGSLRTWAYRYRP